MINNSYQQTACYLNLDETQKKSLDRLVDHYGEILNQGCPIGNTLFTSHDFNTHCCDIYKIISKIIFCDNVTISKKELYILDLAVLFHDISMSIKLDWNRKCHSKESAEYVKKEYKNTSSLLHSESTKTLTVNDVNALQHIITAHSDIKDGSVSDDKNGVGNPNLSSDMPGGINGKLLAAILRLADELDITTDRLGSLVYAEQLSDNDESQAESKKHWKCLHYFSDVINDSEDLTRILLICDDIYITDNLDDISNIVADMKKIIAKITQELNKLNKEVFIRKENAKLNFRAQKVAIRTTIPEIENELKDPFLLFRYGTEITLESNNTDTSLSNKENSPEVISQNLSNTIKEYIETKNLLNCGHYILNDVFCSRDWIDTNDIIETNEICDKCIKEFMNHCINNFDDYSNCIILGLDLEGAILASLLAMNLGIPFQYVIPAKSENTNSLHDIVNSLPPEKKIIIVTDAVCTYETIKSAVEKYKLSDRLIAIYTLLYRHPSLKNITDKALFKKTYCLNSDFPMEISRIANCKYYKNGNCIALNKSC